MKDLQDITITVTNADGKEMTQALAWDAGLDDLAHAFRAIAFWLQYLPGTIDEYLPDPTRNWAYDDEPSEHGPASSGEQAEPEKPAPPTITNAEQFGKILFFDCISKPSSAPERNCEQCDHAVECDESCERIEALILSQPEPATMRKLAHDKFKKSAAELLALLYSPAPPEPVTATPSKVKVTRWHLHEWATGFDEDIAHSEQNLRDIFNDLGIPVEEEK